MIMRPGISKIMTYWTLKLKMKNNIIITTVKIKIKIKIKLKMFLLELKNWTLKQRLHFSKSEI